MMEWLIIAWLWACGAVSMVAIQKNEGGQVGWWDMILCALVWPLLATAAMIASGAEWIQHWREARE